jgi:hypothetical protein
MTDHAKEPGRKNLPQTRRIRGKKPPLLFEPADREILQLVWENRLLTRSMLATLLERPADDTHLARRLQAHFHHGYLDRLVSQETSELAHALGQKGS